MTIEEKQELSQRCNVTWPCLQPCLQDFHAPCPEQWHEVELNPGVCVAPATYTGTCDFIADIGVMSPAQKRAFASQCSINFPCARGQSPIA
jgi:CPW-WPC domain-containing protein